MPLGQTWLGRTSRHGALTLFLTVAAGGFTLYRVDAQSAVPPAAPKNVRLTAGSALFYSPWRPFYFPSSPWNTPIAPDATVDPNSAAMVQTIITDATSASFIIIVKQWTWTLYYADATTPRYTVALTSGYGGSKTKLVGVPIPNGAVPDPAGDGHMIILDTSTGCEYDFWKAIHNSNATWSTAWANAISYVTGNGWYPHGYSATGGGAAGGAGLIRPEEMQAGHIDHAIAFSYTYAKSGGPVWPATEADGSYAVGVPEGGRVQLDPALDLSTLGLKPYEVTIARALQEFGMILMDNGGGVTLEAQNPISSTIAYPWGDQTYVDLPRSLLSHLRVLTTGPQYQPNLFLENTACANFQ